MIWNSAVSSVQSEVKVEFPLLRELVLALNLAPTIAQMPELALEICPNVPISVVCFILCKFVPDLNVPAPLDAFTFMQHYKIMEQPYNVSMPESEFVGFDEIGDIDTEVWNVRKLSPKLQKVFPYLEGYLNTDDTFNFAISDTA
jgi:hypothetical protein